MLGIILLAFALVLAVIAAARVPNPWFDPGWASIAFLAAAFLFGRIG